MGLIYSGQPIKTTYAFDDTLFNGRVVHWLPDGAIAAVLYEDTDYGSSEFGINLDADEWEPITDDPVLHEEMYERGLFND
jgi:hypothetical protein